MKSCQPIGGSSKPQIHAPILVGDVVGPVFCCHGGALDVWEGCESADESSSAMRSTFSPKSPLPSMVRSICKSKENFSVKGNTDE